MTVHSERRTEELAEQGRVEYEVIGLRYVGDASSKPPTEPRRRGGWPGRTPFQRGELQIGLSPTWFDGDTVSGGLVDELESLDDWQVVYDPAELAEALLDRNYLPAVIFGSEEGGYHQPVREAVLEKLGIEDEALPRLPEGEETIKRKLAAVAGVEYEEVATDDSVAAEFTRAASRQQALEAAGALGMDVDEHATPKRDAIQFLVEGDKEAEARRALRDAGVEGV